MTVSSLCLAFSSEPARVTKDVVCFHAGDFNYVVQRLQLDLYEPPLSQVLHYINTHTHTPPSHPFTNLDTESPHMVT